MKRLLLITACLFVVVPSQAQISLFASGGVTFPVSSNVDFLKTGWGMEGGIGASVRGGTTVFFAGHYNRLPLDLDTISGEALYWGVHALFRLHFGQGPAYGLVGVGYTDADGLNTMSLSVGQGLAFSINPSSEFFIEGRGIYLLGSGNGEILLPVRAGITLRVGG